MATNVDQIIRALELFNEKAEKLGRLSFIKTLYAHKSGFSIKVEKTDNGMYQLTQERRAPLKEAIDAFVLTMRFFIQDNESSSFRNLSNHYNNSPLDDSTKKQFNIIRRNINEYLDSNSGMAIYVNDELLNHREILNTVIYGGLSHANPKKKKAHDFWMATPLKAMIENDFVCTLGILYKAIFTIINLNMAAINQLKRNPGKV
jgi:hypothetical protein